jgi:hypothetical protein
MSRKNNLALNMAIVFIQKPIVKIIPEKTILVLIWPWYSFNSPK